MSNHSSRRKRPHVKSRYGCMRCREKRIKCDELLPTCTNCRVRSDSCQYRHTKQLSGVRAFPLSNLNESSASLATTASIATFSKNASPPTMWTHLIDPAQRTRTSIEFRLVHYWCTQTCYSFTCAQALLLRDGLSQRAFECDYLMAALLASSGLHMASETTDMVAKQTLVAASLEHQTRAIQGLSQTLSILNAHNCDDVFLTSVLLMVCAFVSSMSRPRGSIDIIADVTHLLSGTQAVGIACWPWLFQGRAVELFGDFQTSRMHQRAKTMPNVGIASQFDALRGLNDQVSPPEHAMLLAYLITKLESAFLGEIEIVPWLLTAKKGYIRLLRDGDPLALVLLMHYGVLLAGSQDLWWANLAGRRIVKDLATLLEDDAPAVSAMASWCRAQIDVQSRPKSR